MWIWSKNYLAGCMRVIEANDLYYMEEGKIDDTMGMETAITLLQIFKDQNFKNGETRNSLRRRINNKVKN
jgi:hypothetical protein